MSLMNFTKNEIQTMLKAILKSVQNPPLVLNQYKPFLQSVGVVFEKNGDYLELYFQDELMLSFKDSHN